MKKLSIVLALLLVTMPCLAQTSIPDDDKLIIYRKAEDMERVKVIVNPDTVKEVLDTVRILYSTSICEVTYRQVDAEGNSTGKESVYLFIDKEDNAETPEDETNIEFSKLMLSIEKDGIEKSIKIAVDEKTE